MHCNVENSTRSLPGNVQVPSRNSPRRGTLAGAPFWSFYIFYGANQAGALPVSPAEDRGSDLPCPLARSFRLADPPCRAGRTWARNYPRRPSPRSSTLRGLYSSLLSSKLPFPRPLTAFTIDNILASRRQVGYFSYTFWDRGELAPSQNIIPFVIRYILGLACIFYPPLFSVPARTMAIKDLVFNDLKFWVNVAFPHNLLCFHTHSGLQGHRRKRGMRPLPPRTSASPGSRRAPAGRTSALRGRRAGILNH